jgi:hypothetical protein
MMELACAQGAHGVCAGEGAAGFSGVHSIVHSMDIRPPLAISLSNMVAEE